MSSFLFAFQERMNQIEALLVLVLVLVGFT